MPAWSVWSRGRTLVDKAGTTMQPRWWVPFAASPTSWVRSAPPAVSRHGCGPGWRSQCGKWTRLPSKTLRWWKQMAAAASSLKAQAQELVQTVEIFTLSQGHSRAPVLHNTRPMKAHARPHSIAPAAKRAELAPTKRPALGGQAKTLAPPRKTAPPASKPQVNNEQDWETF
jgi:hypothetical protein